jgi:hypothetical protein
MYYFTRLSHIVDGFILHAGMRVWVVCTRTRLPDGYMMLPIYVPAGRNIIPYPSPYRVKPVGYSGFGYPLPSLSLCTRPCGQQLSWACQLMEASFHEKKSQVKEYVACRLIHLHCHVTCLWKTKFVLATCFMSEHLQEFAKITWQILCFTNF